MLSTLPGQGLNPIRHLLALVGARHIVHVSRIRVKMASFELYVLSECPLM